MNRTEAFKIIQSKLRYNFKNIRLLDEALTHDSNRVNDHTVPNYQRLEFLGDSVIYLVVSDHLFRSHPNFNEGQLTIKRKELIEAVKQGQIAEAINVKEYISFGQSVRRDQFLGYHSFVESLIGAVYIDGGLDAARQVIYRLWELVDNNNTGNAGSYCIIS